MKSKRDIPVWFKLSNYTFVDELTDEEILKELELRYILDLYCPDDSDSGSDEELFGAIIEGNPFLAPRDEELRKLEREDWLEYKKNNGESTGGFDNKYSNGGGRSVRLLRTHDIELGYISMEAEGLYVSDGDFTLIKNEVVMSEYNLLAKGFDLYQPIGSIFVTLDCECGTDNEILAELKELLPMWRLRLGISEPEVFHRRKGDLEKVKIYNLLPMFDLILWAKLSDKTVSDRILQDVVDPFGEKEPTFITKTIRPLFNKVFSGERYRDNPVKIKNK